jgi:hypothetical protein
MRRASLGQSRALIFVRFAQETDQPRLRDDRFGVEGAAVMAAATCPGWEMKDRCPAPETMVGAGAPMRLAVS